jgi:hypothetical protein
MLIPKTSTAQSVTVSGVSAPFGTPMTKTFDNVYVFVCNTNCWIAQGTAAQVAVAGTAGNMYVPANTPFTLHAREGINLAVIQDSTGGKASLTLCKGL